MKDKQCTRSCRLRGLLRGAAFVLAGAALLLAAPGAVRADWPTFRGDNARSGHASAGISDQPTVVWKVELGGSVDGSPVVAGGKVFVGTSSGAFAALAAQTGEVLWRTRLDGAICSAAAVAGERLVVGTSRRRVRAYDQPLGETAPSGGVGLRQRRHQGIGTRSPRFGTDVFESAGAAALISRRLRAPLVFPWRIRRARVPGVNHETKLAVGGSGRGGAGNGRLLAL